MGASCRHGSAPPARKVGGVGAHRRRRTGATCLAPEELLDGALQRREAQRMHGPGPAPPDGDAPHLGQRLARARRLGRRAGDQRVGVAGQEGDAVHRTRVPRQRGDARARVVGPKADGAVVGGAGEEGTPGRVERHAVPAQCSSTHNGGSAAGSGFRGSGRAHATWRMGAGVRGVASTQHPGRLGNSQTPPPVFMAQCLTRGCTYTGRTCPVSVRLHSPCTWTPVGSQTLTSVSTPPLASRLPPMPTPPLRPGRHGLHATQSTADVWPTASASPRAGRCRPALAAVARAVVWVAELRTGLAATVPLPPSVRAHVPATASQTFRALMLSHCVCVCVWDAKSWHGSTAGVGHCRTRSTRGPK